MVVVLRGDTVEHWCVLVSSLCHGGLGTTSPFCDRATQEEDIEQPFSTLRFAARYAPGRSFSSARR